MGERLQQQLGIDVAIGSQPVPQQVSTGAADAWRQIASTSASITASISNLADKYAAFQGGLAGEQAGAAAGVPEMAIAGGQPATGGAATGTGTRATVGASPAGIKSRKAYTKAYMEKLGWSSHAAAAIAGGVQQESNFNSSIVGDGGISMGLGQWNGNRLAALRRFAAGRGTSWSNFDTQLAFIDHELRSTESGAGKRLSAARTLEEAASAFIGYERPRGWTLQNPAGGHGYARRLAYAREAMGLDMAGVKLPDLQPSLSPGAAAVPAAEGAVARPSATITMSGAPLQLSGAFTIRGQAYDEAATRVYADRIETAALTGLDEISQKAGDDPAVAQELLTKYRGEFLAQMPPRLRPGMGNFIDRHGLGIQREAARLHKNKLEAETQAAFAENYTQRRTALIQLAGRAGIDPQGNDTVAAELQSLSDMVDATPNVKPGDKVKLKAELNDDVTTARVLAAFESRKGPEERALYAKFLKQSYLSGEGMAAKMSPEAFARIDAQMQGVIGHDETAALKQANAADGSIRSALTRLKDGFAIPEAERAAIKSQVATLNDPALTAQWQLYDGLANWQIANRQQPPEVIDRQIAAMESSMAQNGATAADETVLETMRGLSKQAHDALDKDPLGWAEQTGRMKPTPLDLSSPQGFAASLTARGAEANAVAQTYGRPPVFFKPAEKQALTRAFSENPDMMIGFAPALRQSLGEKDTPRALAEISKDAPVVAHVAGLSMATGDDSFIRETATALKLRAGGDHQAIKMPDDARPPLAALMFLPKTESAAVQTAELVFDLRARQMGLDPKADSATAQRLWGDIISSALGAHEKNGKHYGGLADINGTVTLVPPDWTAEDLQTTLDNLREEDMARLPPIASIEGFPVTVDQIAMGHLVASGNGRYRMALNDPASPDPAYLMAPDGGYWQFDASALLRPRTSGSPDGGGW